MEGTLLVLYFKHHDETACPAILPRFQEQEHNSYSHVCQTAPESSDIKNTHGLVFFSSFLFKETHTHAHTVPCTRHQIRNDAFNQQVKQKQQKNPPTTPLC